MMIEAPVIHIDRTDRGQIIIRQDTFGMDKSRCVLIDLHAGTHPLGQNILCPGGLHLSLICR